MIQYHLDPRRAFPCSTKFLPQGTIDAYKALDVSTLHEQGSRLIDHSPEKYDSRKGGDFFIRMPAAVKPMEVSGE